QQRSRGNFQATLTARRPLFSKAYAARLARAQDLRAACQRGPRAGWGSWAVLIGPGFSGRAVPSGLSASRKQSTRAYRFAKPLLRRPLRRNTGRSKVTPSDGTPVVYFRIWEARTSYAHTGARLAVS